MTQSRVYYVVDLDTRENVLRRDSLSEAQGEARKMNKKVGSRRYKAKGAWIIRKF